eukprot:1152641-Pelagomonas_calceolata.AAC.14
MVLKNQVWWLCINPAAHMPPSTIIKAEQTPGSDIDIDRKLPCCATMATGAGTKEQGPFCQGEQHSGGITSTGQGSALAHITLVELDGCTSQFVLTSC